MIDNCLHDDFHFPIVNFFPYESILKPHVLCLTVRVRIMVINANHNNISAISRRSVLLVEETGVPEENHRPVASH
jgi:hypothetical protein